jgi:uncharacterized protein YkwD
LGADVRPVTRGFCIVCSVLALALPASSASAVMTDGREATRATRALSAIESGLLVRINTVRRSHGVRALKHSRGLSAAASLHSRQMARDGVFRHGSGEAFWKRIERFYHSSGYSSWEVGENLAYGAPELDAVATVRAWLKSPAHRANLLSRTWREIGLGAVHVASAGGAFGNEPVTIVTADFGTRVR